MILSRRLSLAVTVLLAVTSLSPAAAIAQDRGPPPSSHAQGDPLPPPKPWSALSADEKDVLAPLAGTWDGLPPQRQSHMLQKAEHWRGLPPERRAQIRDRIQHWQQMSPDERDEARKNRQAFQNMSPEQRSRLHDAFDRFRDLPPDQRKALRDKWRDQTPEQRRQEMQAPGAGVAVPPPHPGGGDHRQAPRN